MVNSTSNEWEDYDLKPTAYFYPERDFLGGRLTSQKTKEKLHDEFPGEITLTREIYDRVLRQLDKDTAFLCDMNVVDYSCFVVQRRVGRISSDGTGTTETSGWIIDALGEWEYRFTILDFFTSAKMIRIKAMKVGIDMLGHGDMTITASVHGIQVELIQPERYREDWMAMVKENLRIVDTRENRKCHWNNNRLDG